jgi:hypothetical protein
MCEAALRRCRVAAEQQSAERRGKLLHVVRRGPDFRRLAASAFARRAAWSRPVRRRPGKQGGRPGGRCCFARRKQESAARPDRLLVVAPSGRERDVLCDCCTDTGAVASGSSGRLDTPALGLEAEARSCGDRARGRRRSTPPGVPNQRSGEPRTDGAALPESAQRWYGHNGVSVLVWSDGPHRLKR